MDDTDAGTTSGASTENIFIGKDAGGGTWANAASNYNVAVGNIAMDANLNGSLSNTAVGYAALTSLTEGDYNVAIGQGVFGAITTSSGNTGVGTFAGQSITGGLRNTLLGYQALGAADGAESDNIAIGYDAMGNMNNDSAVNNMAIGNYAGDGLGTTGGSDNIFIGHHTGGGIWTGADSTQNVANSFTLSTLNG